MGMFPPPQARPKARCGPIIPVEFDELEESRDFWQNCLVGVIMEFKRFSVRIIQRIINNAWRVRDSVTVVGRVNSNYILHFNNSKDQVFIWHHGPWSVDGALMAMYACRSNIVLGEIILLMIPIWVQI